MKLTKLNKRVTLCKRNGFNIKVEFESFEEWQIIYHWSERTYGDFIVLPPVDSKYVDERQWGITLGEQYEIFFKDECVATILLLMIDNAA